MEKYPETMTLKEVNELEEAKIMKTRRFKNALLKEFKEKYEGKCLKIMDGLFEGDIELHKINEIEVDSWCDDFETLSFTVSTECVSLKDFVGIDEKRLSLYSNVDYEIISEEKYDEAKVIVKDYLNKIKNI